MGEEGENKRREEGEGRQEEEGGGRRRRHRSSLAKSKVVGKTAQQLFYCWLSCPRVC
jgi:hypothetical protein